MLRGWIWRLVELFVEFSWSYVWEVLGLTGIESSEVLINIHTWKVLASIHTRKVLARNMKNVLTVVLNLVLFRQ